MKKGGELVDPVHSLCHINRERREARAVAMHLVFQSSSDHVSVGDIFIVGSVVWSFCSCLVVSQLRSTGPMSHVLLLLDRKSVV